MVIAYFKIYAFPWTPKAASQNVFYPQFDPPGLSDLYTVKQAWFYPIVLRRLDLG